MTEAEFKNAARVIFDNHPTPGGMERLEALLTEARDAGVGRDTVHNWSLEALYHDNASALAQAKQRKMLFDTPMHTVH